MVTNWDLIAKHLAKETTPEEAKEFEAWLAADQSHEELVKKLKVAMRPGQSSENFDHYLEQDWHSIQEKINMPQKTGNETKRIYFFTPYRLAAAIALLIMASFSVWHFTRNGNGLGQQYSALDSVRTIILPDGSNVWLNKFSTLTVSHQFGKQTRNVKLEGEAYFEVIKDKNKPFLISSGKIITQVVGTAFDVDQEKSGSVRVVVTEGKVLVKKSESENVSLTQGEFANYSARNDGLTKGYNQDLNFIAWKTGVLRFEGEPLNKVCAYLGDYYRADLRLGDAQLENVTISTVIDNADLQNALSIISLTLNLKIEKRGQVFYLKK